MSIWMGPDPPVGTELGELSLSCPSDAMVYMRTVKAAACQQLIKRNLDCGSTTTSAGHVSVPTEGGVSEVKAPDVLFTLYI